MDRQARIVAGEGKDMTREDIIRMARESGMETHEHKGQVRIGSAVITGCDSTESVARFAALVAAAEREACAQLCDPYIDSPSDHEAGTAGSIQDAIRARGNE